MTAPGAVRHAVLVLALAATAACASSTTDTSEPTSPGSPTDAATGSDVTGETVVLPAQAAEGEIAPGAFVVVGDAQTPRPVFERETPRAIAQQDCDDVIAQIPQITECTARPVEQQTTPAGAEATVWNTGTAEPLVTVAFDDWTLALRGPDRELALQIAGALDYEARADGTIAVWSTDPDVRGDADGIVDE